MFREEIKLELQALKRNRREEGKEPIPDIFEYILMAGPLLVAFAVAAGIVVSLFQGLHQLWEALPGLLRHNYFGAVAAAGIVAIAGRLLFAFRESRFRRYYAGAELGAAAGTAFHATLAIQVEDPWRWTISILGALFIAVRGYENLKKDADRRKLESGSAKEKGIGLTL